MALYGQDQLWGSAAVAELASPHDRSATAANGVGHSRPPTCARIHSRSANLVLLCRRHHTRWHQGLLHLTDLHVPWLTHTHTTHDPP